MAFRFTRLEIPDVILVEAKAFNDDRGFFVETYKNSEFTANGISDRFVQDNYSHSKRHVLRGLHYQKEPKAQSKLVAVFHGCIFDVAVARSEEITLGIICATLVSMIIFPRSAAPVVSSRPVRRAPLPPIR